MTDGPPGRHTANGEAPGHEDSLIELQHRWIRIRLIGWSLIGIWQLLSLMSEFVPLGLERRAIRITAKTTGLLGLILVAYGFERLAELTHHHQMEHQAHHDRHARGGGGPAS